MPRRELGIRGDTEQTEARSDLVLEDLERTHQARRPRGREPEAAEAADADGLGTERDRLNHIGAAHEATVYPDFRAAVHRVHNFGQHGGAAEAVVELPAAVIGDIDDFDAVLDRELGIFRSGDALD